MTEIVDREAEIEILDDAMERAINGSGSTIFISGEAGIGKSALCEAIAQKAEEKGFQVLKSWCFPEYLKPYLPIEKALRPLEMAHLFEGSAPPRIESIFLIANSGILLTSVEREESEIDGDIFTGMLTAVGHFVKDSLEMMAGEGSLNVLGYGDMRIIIERGDVCSMATVISGKENEYLLEDMKEVVRKVHSEYGDALREWDNDMESMAGTSEIIASLLKSGKYAGVDYARDDPKLRKGNIMENVSMGIMRVSENNPLLLIVEDLQWADSSTLALISYISRNIRRARVLIVGTSRPEDVGEGSTLFETLAYMRAEELAGEMKLDPLKKDAIYEMTKNRIGDSVNAENLAKKIFEESGGNPLFASEMLDAIVEQGLTEEIAEKGEIEGLRIPKKMQDMIRGRLERLSEEELEIVEAASVLGQEFTGSILAKMLGKRKIEVLKLLRRLDRHANLVEESGGKYRFVNPKIRELIYEGMGSEMAQAYHEVAAQSLEELYGESPDHSVLGYHYYMARIEEKAIAYLLNAAEEAKREYSNEEALKELSYVLEIAEPEKWDSERKMALELMGDIYTVIGEYEKAIESLREAEKTAKEPDNARILRKIGEAYQQMSKYEESLEVLKDAEKCADGLELGRTLLTEGNVLYRKGEYEEAMASFEKALESFKEHGAEASDISTAIRAIGNIHYSKGDYEKALKNYEKALEAGDLSGKAMSLNNMGVIHVRLGRYDKAAEYFEEALKIREKIGDRWGTAMFLSNLGVVKSESGEYDSAMEYFRRSLKIREKIGDRWGTAMSLNNIGMIHLEKGEYERSTEYFRRAMDIREKIGDRDGFSASMISMGMAYVELGEGERSAELCKEALEIKKEIGDRGGVAEALNCMGRAYALEGREKSALDSFERSLRISEETDNRRMMAYNLCSLSELYLSMKKVEKVEECCEKMDGILEELKSREMDAWALRIKGLLSYEKGDRNTAEELLRRSAEMYRSMGRTGDMAKSLYWLAVVSGEKGRKFAEEALLLFRKNGMKGWEEDLKEFMGPSVH